MDDIKLVIKNLLYDYFSTIATGKIPNQFGDFKEQDYSWGYPDKWTARIGVCTSEREAFQYELHNYTAWHMIYLHLGLRNSQITGFKPIPLNFSQSIHINEKSYDDLKYHIIEYCDKHLFKKLNITQVCDCYQVFDDSEHSHYYIDDGYKFIAITIYR